jgi:Uma2 family endonuclease
MSTAAAAQIAPPELTLEEWADMNEDEPGELVDGQLVPEEEPDYTHETIVGWLGIAFFQWVVPRGGFVALSGVKFAVGAKRGRKPDMSVYLPGGAVPPRHGVVRVPPDIMVEVISRRARDVRRDRIEKVGDYAAFGVRYYWLIQPNARTVEVYELQPGGFYLRVLGASAGTIDVPGCADLRIDLDALWAYVARLGPPAEEEPASQPAQRKAAGVAKPKKAGRRRA